MMDPVTATFSGFPLSAFEFYDDLEFDNTKSFWEANKHIYAEAVKAPMAALTDALAEEFGAAKIFRPYRDVRFARDKTPYKTHQGAYVATAPATGWYVQVGADGVMVGAGFYDASGEHLSAVREAIDDDVSGPRLVKIVQRLTGQGWTIGGDTLKTAPRGYDTGHPRIELLRHKTFILSRSYGVDPVVHTPALVGRIRDDWRQAKPFLDWLPDPPE